MLWIKRLFASRLKLVGAPNFEKAPWYHIDLAGTRVALKHPRKTSITPNKIWPKTFDIYEPDNFEHWPDGNGMSKMVYRNMWSYKGRLFKDDHVGGLRAEIIITRKGLHNNRYDTFLEPDQALAWVLDGCIESEREYNDNALRGIDDLSAPFAPLDPFDPFDPATDLWVFPKTADDIGQLEVNGQRYYHYRYFTPGNSWKEQYYTPISDEHMLMVFFTPSTDLYIERDDNNVEAEAEKSIAAFMEHLHIYLSDDVKVRQREVQKNKTTA
jgi:hypothetical protein